MKRILVIFLLLFSSCDEKKDEKNLKSEYICRSHDTIFFPIQKPKLQKKELYPWEEGKVENLSKITKEFFRCRGSSSNPLRENYKDCGGVKEHSLPVIHGKEGVYPILIEILNYIQFKTKKRVVITSGHRCPRHNSYVDVLKKNKTSKHMIGAVVNFYVQDMEYEEGGVLDLVFSFYKEKKRYKGKKEYESFKRLGDNGYCNGEIFVKIFERDEGRDFDNRHPYPYLKIEVKYDRDRKESVCYSWGKANKNYLRW
jgi:hypothetical protein